MKITWPLVFSLCGESEENLRAMEDGLLRCLEGED